MANMEKIVTEFLLSTCRSEGPRLNKGKTYALESSALAATKHPSNDPDADMVPLPTGSSAEFYIQPMLSCVGDIDVMIYYSSTLVVPEGLPPPTWLPVQFTSNVIVAESIQSDQPGYVYLKSRYKLTESGDEGGYYEAVEINRNFVKNRAYLGSKSDMHGPAMLTPGTQNVLSVDNVFCIRCLSWPPQAADWPTRQRNHGWPDSATVDGVVSNGCDVVGAVHRLCRQDEWKNSHQYRLSFSRAEVELINSWVPLQQIAYHMLRVFVKTERFTDETFSPLSNYHVKTLMLWACELKPRSWWTDDCNLVRICAELLHELASWLTDKRVPHYFISNCNLLDNVFNAEAIASRLKSVDRAQLSNWFVTNYIRKCAQLSPAHIARLFDDVTRLQDAVSAVVAWQQNAAIYELRLRFIAEQYHIVDSVSNYSLTIRSCDFWMTELSKNDERLLVFFTATTLLHVARKIQRNGFSDELLDLLTVALGQFVCTRRYSKRRKSNALSLTQAAKLMKVAANNSRSTVQLIEIELSKAYLHRALRCKYSDGDSTYCLANVYLAVLCYTTGQHQTAIDHCTLVTRSQDHSQGSSQVVQGELLPKVDDNVDIALGLVVFYQYVRTAALNQPQQAQRVGVFTTEVFANYLHLKCLSVTSHMRMSSTEVKQHVHDNMESKQLFITDVLLLMSLNRLLMESATPHQCAQHSTTHSSTPELVELLQQCAVEHLTTFRQFEARDVGHIAATVTSDFEAVYAYKRGDYQKCLQLSEQNVEALLPAPPGDDFPTFPEFIQLLDDDIVSLTALTLLVNPQCRKTNVMISRLTLSLYLVTQCWLKLGHTVCVDNIKVARASFPATHLLNHLLLTLTERKALFFINK